MKITLHSRHNEIVSLLENNFITHNKGGLNQIYNELFTFSKIDNETEKSNQKRKLSFTDLSNLNSSFLNIVNEVNKKDTALFFATDLPIYLESTHKKNAPTIMVCAMDSLPPLPIKISENNYKLYEHQNTKFDLKNNVGFWAPFSLVEHNNDDNAKFFKALLTQYNVYVTDVYKLFFYTDKNKINEKGEYIFKKSNGLSKYRKLQSHKNILTSEINIIKPSCIITLGNNAGNALLNIEDKNLELWENCLDFGGLQKNDTNKITASNKSIKIISMPHISGAANGNKSRIIENDFYKNIPGENIEKYANILLHEIAITIGNDTNRK